MTLAPAFLLTFAAGAVFGLWRGTLLVYVGAVLGASAVYALAAPLARSRVLGWIDRDPRVAAVRRAVVKDSAWIMFLLRLSPLVPYNLLNYALALSGVTLSRLPAGVGRDDAGHRHVRLLREGRRRRARTSPPASRRPAATEYYVMLVVGLIATFAATHLISRAAKKAMSESQKLQKTAKH